MYTPPSLEQLGLIAYYNFNSGSGNTLYDQTSNSLNGSIMGGPQWVDGFTVSGILGDVNFDENLNIYDAVMLVAIMLGVENGKVEIIPNDQGNRITPSYVAFTENERLIGDSAKNQVATNPFNTIFDAKR